MLLLVALASVSCFAELDFTVSPERDFYTYANGKWLEQNPRPLDQPVWGTFTVLAQETSEKLKNILNKELLKPKGQSVAAELYLSGMDMKARNSHGIAPIRDLLGRIDSISSASQVWKVTG
jgi:putative endopeptidase